MPKNLLIENTKPSNLALEDIKPKVIKIEKDTATTNYQVSYGANQAMGLLLTLTYTTASGTMTQWTEKG